MTREDAERKIRAVFTNYFYFAGDREADEVIEALRQEPKYCDRNICVRNEHNGIGCGECEVTKSGEPCEDWYDVPSDEMTLEQARQAVRDLRKMWAEHLDQKPCEDAISRAEVLKKAVYSETEEGWSGYTVDVEDIKDMPSVQPQTKTGHWYVNEWGNITCSECGCAALYDKVYPNKSMFGEAIRVKSTFCSTCGAKMAESEEHA